MINFVKKKNYFKKKLFKKIKRLSFSLYISLIITWQIQKNWVCFKIKIFFYIFIILKVNSTNRNVLISIAKLFFIIIYPHLKKNKFNYYFKKKKKYFFCFYYIKTNNNREVEIKERYVVCVCVCVCIKIKIKFLFLNAYIKIELKLYDLHFDKQKKAKN
jgi:hypothetical protein